MQQPVFILDRLYGDQGRKGCENNRKYVHNAESLINSS